MKRRLFASVLIVAAVLPAIALARRKATRHERRAVVAAAVAAHDISRAQGPCARVFVSTVNPRWASLDFPPHPSKACLRHTANGVALFHKRGGQWRFVTVGSSFRCPIRGVPPAVARDLRVC